MKFAEPLKDMTRTLFWHMGFDRDMTERLVEGDLKKEFIAGVGWPESQITSRLLQQTLGTNWGRDTVHPNFWVDITMSKVRKLLDTGKSVVIDDLRFPNEYRTLTQAGAYRFTVIRPDAEPGDPRYEGQLNDYPFDAVLMNDGTIEKLKARAKALVDTIRIGRRPHDLQP